MSAWSLPHDAASAMAGAGSGDIDVQASASPAPEPAALAAWARAALEATASSLNPAARDVARLNLCIRIMDEAESRALNEQFRQQPRATNVLAFPSDAPGMLGDIAICAPVVEREARRARRPFDAHFAHILVHGVLHLQGMDHQQEGEAQRMAARETDILLALGFADPHASP